MAGTLGPRAAGARRRFARIMLRLGTNVPLGNHTFSSSRCIAAYAMKYIVAVMAIALPLHFISSGIMISSKDEVSLKEPLLQQYRNFVRGPGAQSVADVSKDVAMFWENTIGMKTNFKYIRSNPVLPSFFYGFPEKEVDQRQVIAQQILEPYVSIKLAEHLHTCCVSRDGTNRGHFLDIGGNFGWYALLAAASGCDVDSFEPVDWFRYLFETTAKLNGFTSSIGQSQLFNIHPMIVSDVPDIELELHIPMIENGLMGAAGVNGMNVGGANKHNAIKLNKQTTTIKELGIKPKHRSCAIKVDVEGFEPKVLAGGRQFIDQNHPPMIILELSPGMTRDGVPEMLKQLEESGYRPHLLGWGVIKNPDPATWLTSLSDFAVEWNADEMIRACGFNCMLLLVHEA